jgi:hypothetical protein
MILNKEKLVLFTDNELSMIYYYYVNKEESERIVVFYLIKNTQSVSIYLYIEGKEDVLKEKTFYCKNTLAMKIDKFQCYEIDHKSDLISVEAILKAYSGYL